MLKKYKQIQIYKYITSKNCFPVSKFSLKVFNFNFEMLVEIFLQNAQKLRSLCSECIIFYKIQHLFFHVEKKSALQKIAKVSLKFPFLHSSFCSNEKYPK